MPNRKPYPSYVSDGEWAFVAPYLALVRRDSPRRSHDLRKVFDALRWVLRTGSPLRYMPHDSPPWEAVLPADPAVARRHCVFEAIVHYLRAVLRLAWGREPEPSAVVLDTRMLPPVHAGERGRGLRRPQAQARLEGPHGGGHARAPLGSAGGGGLRAGAGRGRTIGRRCAGGHRRVGGACVRGWSYIGDEPARAVQERGIRPEVIKQPGAKRGFVLLPRRWGVQRSFAWLSRFRRLARERLPGTLAGLHFVAFACFMLHQLVVPA